MQDHRKWKRINLSEHREEPGGSSYLIAQNRQVEEAEKELLYEVLGPVFFGKKEAENERELAVFFAKRYGIDVHGDFCEGDEHYEEYQEACQAISEGLSVYSGRIDFNENSMAELAEELWSGMEQIRKNSFRRINTLLEE
jgi:hypothetical protein